MLMVKRFALCNFYIIPKDLMIYLIHMQRCIIKAKGNHCKESYYFPFNDAHMEKLRHTKFSYRIIETEAWLLLTFSI